MLIKVACLAWVASAVSLVAFQAVAFDGQSFGGPTFDLKVRSCYRTNVEVVSSCSTARQKWKRRWHQLVVAGQADLEVGERHTRNKGAVAVVVEVVAGVVRKQGRRRVREMEEDKGQTRTVRKIEHGRGWAHQRAADA